MYQIISDSVPIQFQSGFNSNDEFNLGVTVRGDSRLNSLSDSSSFPSDPRARNRFGTPLPVVVVVVVVAVAVAAVVVVVVVVVPKPVAPFWDTPVPAVVVVVIAVVAVVVVAVVLVVFRSCCSCCC